jgi:hypothetical protein
LAGAVPSAKAAMAAYANTVRNGNKGNERKYKKK